MKTTQLINTEENWDDELKNAKDEAEQGNNRNERRQVEEENMREEELDIAEGDQTVISQPQ